MAEIPNRGPELRAVAITITIMATAATAMRCYVRVWMVKAFGIDDWFMLIALVWTSVALVRIPLTHPGCFPHQHYYLSSGYQLRHRKAYGRP